MPESASSLYKLLDQYRATSHSERNKGTRFEELAKVYFENDDLQRQEFDEVYFYGEWAEAHGRSKADTGIDLVARLRDGHDGDSLGYCAIQCKFYAKDHVIQKPDIDSFFTESGKKPFTRRIIIDTTEVEYGKNALAAFDHQNIPSSRIGLSQIGQSRIDWAQFLKEDKIIFDKKKTPREHQREALAAVEEAFNDGEDRGKIIMACGTGKTYTALHIVEELIGKPKSKAGESGLVLFLVPSLSLMSQTVTEWKNDANDDFNAFAVCSDSQIGIRKKSDDIGDLESHDLAFPATTDAKTLAAKVAQHQGYEDSSLTVIFATYHSIQVLSQAQKKHGLPDFDLIICDEAHRTTGATLAGAEETNFVAVHKNDFIKADKRLYMTATPRIYGEPVKAKAAEVSATLASMDDESLFGKVIFHRGFSWAVENDHLTDYKVIVLAMDEGIVSDSVQSRLSEGAELTLDDATKIIGCYKALTKENLRTDLEHDPLPVKRGLAFCKTIAASKTIEAEFSAVVEEYLTHVENEKAENAQQIGLKEDQKPYNSIQCEIQHVDGSYRAKERTVLLDWLKDEPETKNTCRILTNAKCLSEGVDVPALDAIMFMHPRKSQVDVVQSVGRVMRRAPNKKLGYVILPVTIPAGVEPSQALNQNERYKVVWQILNALRAHDDSFDAKINQASLGEDISDSIEVIAVSNHLPNQPKPKQPSGIGTGSGDDTGDDDKDTVTGGGGTIPLPTQADFVFDEFTKAIMAKIVKKCGTRDYWEDWAKDIGKIAQQHITRIKSIVSKDGDKRNSFLTFLEELRDDLNGEITEDEAIEMLAQHLITKPVFDALFQGHNFTKENPVSQAMQIVLEILQEDNIDKESASLEKFYASVHRRAKDIKTAHGRQQLIVQLYDKFFSKAFPRLKERLGIVYTPIEVVDFIIHSVNDVLKDEFGQTLGSKGVHIIDPFTGTGTFITRLLQSGLIKPEELKHKYKNEIHANEIVLLAYYIAAINIEASFHELAEAEEFIPFEGICLTDTFQMYEKQDLIQKLMPDNSQRRIRQRALDLRVIMGNPPYSSGQKSANDNAANIEYPHLDQRIADTYAASASANVRNLYDSYIRAIRWGSDRLGDAGVMAYVSGSAWVERSFADGMRKCLAEEFTNLYVFHLRGDIRKNMLSKGAAKEGGNIFDSGSMTGIAITLFVKNPKAKQHGQIHFHDIGDDLSSNEKKQIIQHFNSIQGVAAAQGWEEITPDKHNDWLDQRDENFESYPILYKKNEECIFLEGTIGLTTNRDTWCYNASKANLSENLTGFIGFYEEQRKQLNHHSEAGTDHAILDSLTKSDLNKISWSRGLKNSLKRNIKIDFNATALTVSHYRPYTKTWTYFSRDLNEYVYQLPRIFPSNDVENLVIHISGTGARSGFSALMVNCLPDIQHIDNGQCFPLKLYEKAALDCKDELFSQESSTAHEGYTVKDGITDSGLAYYQNAYGAEGKAISKEDVFYYIYGLLHNPDYRKKYANNLAKQLPRIPAVKSFANFQAFTIAGRKLGDLHVNYERVEQYPVTINGGEMTFEKKNTEYYRLEKMKYGKLKGKTGAAAKDLTTIIYNGNITITDIPKEAYDYIINGKPAIDWVMERQCVKTDKKSGITNDANDYANETEGNPAYPLELLLRVITVSLETQRIVNNLPKLTLNK